MFLKQPMALPSSAKYYLEPRKLNIKEFLLTHLAYLGLKWPGVTLGTLLSAAIKLGIFSSEILNISIFKFIKNFCQIQWRAYSHRLTNEDLHLIKRGWSSCLNEIFVLKDLSMVFNQKCPKIYLYNFTLPGCRGILFTTLL